MSTTNPRVAILSPYHNRAHAVERTFLSIADQTFRDFEAIIWDDNSSDDTWSAMQRVTAELSDRRFRTFRNDANMGLTRGLNHALTRTSAEYIAIVGSGDTCHPQRIERQVEALDRCPDAVFCATASTTFDPVRGTTFFDSRYNSDTIKLGDIVEECPFTHGSVMYRASALREVGDYETVFRWCADWDMFFRLLRTGDAVYLREVLYWRVAQVDGVSFDPQKAFEQIQSKRLVLRVSRLDEANRRALLERAACEGFEAVLDPIEDHVARDLARRNIKIFLMGRTDAGDEMVELAAAKHIDYPPRYRRLIGIARRLGKLPLDTDRLIRAARTLPR